jgi:hypothetical protein
MRLARRAWQNTCTFQLALMCKKDRDGPRGVIVDSLAVMVFVLGVKSGANTLWLRYNKLVHLQGRLHLRKKDVHACQQHHC